MAYFPSVYRSYEWSDTKLLPPSKRYKPEGNLIAATYGSTYRPKQWFFSNSVSGDYVRPTAFSACRINMTPGMRYYEYRGTYYEEPTTGNIGYSPYIEDAYSTAPSVRYDLNSVNRVITEALANLNGSKANIAVSWGERAETAHSLISLGTDVLKAVVSLRKGDFRGFYRAVTKGERRPFNKDGVPIVKDMASDFVTRTFPDRWLEYQYGIKPLLSDFNDLKDVWNNGLGSELFVEGKSHYKTTLNDGKYPDSYSSKVYATSHYNARFRALVNEPSKVGLRLLGLDNPFALGWELIPYSFVVDWALPIGTWLQATNASLGVDFFDGHVSVKHSGVELVKTSPPNGASQWKPPRAANFTFSVYGRKTFGTFPIPMPYVKNPLSGHHMVTSLALLINQLRR